MKMDIKRIFIHLYNTRKGYFSLFLIQFFLSGDEFNGKTERINALLNIVLCAFPSWTAG